MNSNKKKKLKKLINLGNIFPKYVVQDQKDSLFYQQIIGCRFGKRILLLELFCLPYFQVFQLKSYFLRKIQFFRLVNNIQMSHHNKENILHSKM